MEKMSISVTFAPALFGAMCRAQPAAERSGCTGQTVCNKWSRQKFEMVEEKELSCSRNVNWLSFPAFEGSPYGLGKYMGEIT